MGEDVGVKVLADEAQSRQVVARLDWQGKHEGLKLFSQLVYHAVFCVPVCQVVSRVKSPPPSQGTGKFKSDNNHRELGLGLPASQKHLAALLCVKVEVFVAGPCRSRKSGRGARLAAQCLPESRLPQIQRLVQGWVSRPWVSLLRGLIVLRSLEEEEDRGREDFFEKRELNPLSTLFWLNPQTECIRAPRWGRVAPHFLDEIFS
jgi:hypothetical protein